MWGPQYSGCRGHTAIGQKLSGCYSRIFKGAVDLAEGRKPEANLLPVRLGMKGIKPKRSSITSSAPSPLGAYDGHHIRVQVKHPVEFGGRP